MLRTPRWLAFTAVAVISMIAFGLLSHWQWSRAADERSASQQVLDRSAEPAVPLTSLVTVGAPMPAEANWRSVTVAGAYDCEAGALVRNRPQAGNGLWVVCPLRTDDGSVLWVNRGWVPAGRTTMADVDLPEPPADTVALTGILRPPESTEGPWPDDLPARQVTHLDTALLCTGDHVADPTAAADLRRECGSGHFAPYLEVTESSPADSAEVVPIAPPTPSGLRNLAYAGQWLLFAGVVIVGWFYFLRREAQESTEPTPRSEDVDQQPVTTS